MRWGKVKRRFFNLTDEGIGIKGSGTVEGGKGLCSYTILTDTWYFSNRVSSQYNIVIIIFCMIVIFGRL